jgi:heme-degrading monooxygenase HmoA
MIAVIFEVQPREGRRDQYLDMAAELRPLLHEVDGFISVERFESLTTPGKLLSVSFWRDEAALERWRRMDKHRTAQSAGRREMFEAYRIRVAGVIRDYSMEDRAQVPQDSKALHDAG